MTYNLHLESRGTDALRISQLGEVLSDATCYDAECPVIVAGDLNLDASREPVALALAKARFQDAVASSRSTPTTPARGLFEGGRQIDWAFRSRTTAGEFRPGAPPGQSVGPLSDLLHADWIDRVRSRYQFRRQRASWEDGSGRVLCDRTRAVGS